MSQVITTRNHKQSGGTYVNIRRQSGSSSSVFEKSQDNGEISKILLEECEFIGCINALSLNSTTFYGVSSKDGNIELRSEKDPETKTYQFCIKVAFIQTPETPPDLRSIDITFKDSREEEQSIKKLIKTEKEVIDEEVTQKLLFNSLKQHVSNYIIPDIIATNRVTPEYFEQCKIRWFDLMSKKEEDWKVKEDHMAPLLIEKNKFTRTVVESIIQTAIEHNLDLRVTFMDYESGINFETYLQTNCPDNDETLQQTPIVSVSEFYDTGYYKDVYKIAQIVGAYIISILEITGNWNYDLNTGNIMVNGDGGVIGCSNIRLIDFGYTKNLKDPQVKAEIESFFRTYFESSSEEHKQDIQNFMLVSKKDGLAITKYPLQRMDIVADLFSQQYKDIIMQLSKSFTVLLKKDQSDEDKKSTRKIVFKLLMFLAFIDGLMQNKFFGKDGIQCKIIMEFMFNCKIFDNLLTLVKFSSLDYSTFLSSPNGFERRLPILNNLDGSENNGHQRYKRICNTFLDNLCIRIAEVLSESGKEQYPSSAPVSSAGGGQHISKKIYRPRRKSSARRRRPSRKSSATKRRRSRRPHRRTARK
jgi:hypothetical protein